MLKNLRAMTVAMTATAALAGVGLASAAPASADTSLGDRIAQTAYGQVGQTDGTQYGDASNSEWCAYFASWVWHKTDGNLPGNIAYTGNLYAYGTDNGTESSTPHVGDWVIYGNAASGSFPHSGVVVKVKSNNLIDTVEGNYSHKVSLNHNVSFTVNGGTATGDNGAEPGPITGFVSPA